MKKKKIISGCLGVLVGYILFILIIDIISKPSNVSVSLKPIESIQSYFFGLSFGMGSIGLILGSLFLIGILILFYFIGTLIHKLTFKN